MKGLKFANEEEETFNGQGQNRSQAEIDRNFSRSLKIGIVAMMKFATENKFDKIYEDIETFKAFVHFAMSTVIARGTWRLVRTKQCVSDIFTIYDEALALALLDNSCDDWNKINADRDQDDEDIGPGPTMAISLTKYTCYRMKMGQKVRLRRGWSVRGVQRYNEFVQLVKRVRNNRTDFESKTCDNYKASTRRGADTDLNLNNEDDEELQNVYAETGIEL